MPVVTEFERYKDEKGVQRCKSKHCDGGNYKCESGGYGTKNLGYHLTKCKAYLAKLSGGQKQLAFQYGDENKLLTWKFGQNESRKALAHMLVVDELPFSFVEGVGFRYYNIVTQPLFKVPCRSTSTTAERRRRLTKVSTLNHRYLHRWCPTKALKPISIVCASISTLNYISTAIFSFFLSITSVSTPPTNISNHAIPTQLQTIGDCIFPDNERSSPFLVHPTTTTTFPPSPSVTASTYPHYPKSREALIEIIGVSAPFNPPRFAAFSHGRPKLSNRSRACSEFDAHKAYSNYEAASCEQFRTAFQDESQSGKRPSFI
ncbi:unnamed protein product [Lactuca virosa]|uniref:Uncharacterized protein n=1 Tax=Lactuca virosa TaxID=75947 RepID=A0AAU9MIT3_9ASTR|nr:unnamed protein product [Lactuca virosa]